MKFYDVVLMDEQGKTEEIKDYGVRWDPEKVDADEVASACAVQKTFESGKCTRNGQASFNRLFQPISATLKPDPAELVI